MFKKYKEQIKQLQEQNNELNTKLEETNKQLSIEKSARSSLSNTLQSMQIKYREGYELDRIKEDIEEAKNVLADMKHQILETQVELDNINKELVQNYNKHEIQTMGLYDPLFPKYSTEEYKDKIKEIREQRGDMLRYKEYYSTKSQWTYNGNSIQGSKLLDFFVKQSITAFNLSVDAFIDRVTISNINNIKDRVTKMFNNINTELNKHEVSFNYDYLQLILKELDYKHDLELRKQKDKEDREYQKMIIKEQEATEKELNKQREQLLKEREKYIGQLNKGQDVQDKIDEIDQAIENNEYKKEHTLAGYVYIINNPSLGENVYKIGVTRRTNWEQRVDELSSASVPFRFSPNCVLFSENAFALETALHREFDKYRVNKVNRHKEYFKLPLEDIEKVVREKYDENAEFDYDAVDENWLISKDC